MKTESYMTLLNEIANILNSKNNEIAVLKWKIADLQAELEKKN
jgi:hypothetical protein